VTPDASTYTDPCFISSQVKAAFQRIQQHIIHTRLVEDSTYHVWLKCENEQKTGSFKWRGALSKLSLLDAGQTIVTASTGNHGLGVANAAEIFGLKAQIFIPKSASPKKIERLRSLGADLHIVDGDSLEAELTGKRYAAQHGLAWVSPYNDMEVIAGQGTIGLEITNELPKIDKVYVTVGGGGLISGVAGWIRHHHPYAEVIGCQPLNSPEMYLSVLAGHVVEAPESLQTLSDGSAGPLEEDSITFPICRELIDRFILINEEEIMMALRHLYHHHQLVVEGAAGVAMAAAIKDMERQPGETAVVVLCGGNIDPVIHQRICS
jgi:threonine dehydratase